MFWIWLIGVVLTVITLSVLTGYYYNHIENLKDIIDEGGKGLFLYIFTIIVCSCAWFIVIPAGLVALLIKKLFKLGIKLGEKGNKS